jgi:hypothetical protein
MQPPRAMTSTGRISIGSLLLGAAIAAGAAFLTGTVAQADAPRRQARDTHIGQRLDDFVVLQLINPTTSPIFVRGHDDGTRDSTEFTVPTGSRLVITETEYAIGGNGVNFATLRLFVEKSSNRTLVSILTNQTTNANAGSGSSAQTWGATGVISGFVVGAGARIVSDLQNVSSAAGGGTTLSAYTSTAATIVLRGYLVKDE